MIVLVIETVLNTTGTGIRVSLEIIYSIHDYKTIKDQYKEEARILHESIKF